MEAVDALLVVEDSTELDDDELADVVAVEVDDVLAWLVLEPVESELMVLVELDIIEPV